MDQKAPYNHVIETASATTSSDNSNSGPFAYIVACIALAVTVLGALGFAGLMSVALIAAADADVQSGDFGPLSDTYGYELDDMEDFDMENFLRELYGDESDDVFGRPTGAQPGKSSTVSPEEALDFDLAAYGDGVNGEVSASAYAGTPEAVRTFVRSVVSTDSEYAAKVVRALDSAALNNEQRAEKLDEALAACKEAGEAISALELPTVEGDEDGTVKDGLGTAKSEVLARWECLTSEIELLKGEEIDTSRLWDRDDDVVEATEKAGDLLEDALASAARSTR